MTPRFATFLAAGLALLPLACRGENSHKPTFAVTGKVTIDGKPAEHATVVLHPVGGGGPEVVKPRGKVTTNGTFTLTTYDGNDGAPAGDYLVTVELWLAGVRADDPPSNRLPAKFAKPEASGLTATVLAGPTTLEPIALKR